MMTAPETTARIEDGAVLLIAGSEEAQLFQSVDAAPSRVDFHAPVIDGVS